MNPYRHGFVGEPHPVAPLCGLLLDRVEERTLLEVPGSERVTDTARAVLRDRVAARRARLTGPAAVARQVVADRVARVSVAAQRPPRQAGVVFAHVPRVPAVPADGRGGLCRVGG